MWNPILNQKATGMAGKRDARIVELRGPNPYHPLMSYFEVAIELSKEGFRPVSEAYMSQVYQYAMREKIDQHDREAQYHREVEARILQEYRDRLEEKEHRRKVAEIEEYLGFPPEGDIHWNGEEGEFVDGAGLPVDVDFTVVPPEPPTEEMRKRAEELRKYQAQVKRFAESDLVWDETHSDPEGDVVDDVDDWVDRLDPEKKAQLRQRLVEMVGDDPDIPEIPWGEVQRVLEAEGYSYSIAYLRHLYGNGTEDDYTRDAFTIRRMPRINTRTPTPRKGSKSREFRQIR